VEFRLGDWFAPVTGRRFDLVLSNPPYVAAEDPAMHSDSLRFEPRMALTPGTDALAALRAIVAAAPGHLLPEGWLLLEHGATQGGAVRDLLVARGFRHVGSLPDLAGHERVTEGQWPAQPAPGSNLAHRNHHAPL
jgi:release factor glutamine methyltransferase